MLPCSASAGVFYICWCVWKGAGLVGWSYYPHGCDYCSSLRVLYSFIWNPHRPYYQVLKLRTIRMGVLFYFANVSIPAYFNNVFAGIGMKLITGRMLRWATGPCWAISSGGWLPSFSAWRRCISNISLQADLSCWAWLLFLCIFEVQTDGLYERMKYPVIIRSTGVIDALLPLIPVIPDATQRMPYKICSMDLYHDYHPYGHCSQLGREY